MDIQAYLLTGFLSGIMGIILIVLGYKVFDWATPGWDFKEIFGRWKFSNGGIVIAAYLLGLSLIIAMAVG